MSTYYKYFWKERTGELETNEWGFSTYYIEVDDSSWVVRQIEVFDDGQVLKYDVLYLQDKYGCLADTPIDKKELLENQISEEEFNSMWQNTSYQRYSEIVCEKDMLGGSPHLKGRRLSVGDIVSLIDLYHEDITQTLKDFELTFHQVEQSLKYCKALMCISDKPKHFCHNCIFRVVQTGELVDKEDPEQRNWERAERLLEKYFTEKLK